jgi:colanic acid biosynthesis glycosyl transferase WcaI
VTSRKAGSWLVVNQSQSPQFQDMLEALARTLGPCELMTGMPHATRTGALKVTRGPAYRRLSVRARALSWLAFSCRAAWRMFAGRRPAFVFVTTNPPTLPALAWLLSVIRGVPYVLLFWDIYPDHAVRMGWLHTDGVIARAWRALNRRSLLRASAVVTVGHAMAATLRQDAAGIDVIPNWADTDAIHPVVKAQNAFAVEHAQVDRLTVLYSGNIGLTHGVDRLVEAAADLRDLPDLSILIVGDGLGLEPARQAAAKHDLRNVVFLPRQSWGSLPLLLAAGDIAVVIQEPGTEHLSVPSKTYSALAAGSAILALTSHHSDLAQLVREHQVGVVCPPDSRAIAAAVRQMRADPARLDALRRRARATAEQYFSAPVVKSRLLDVMSPLTMRRGDA